MRRWFFRMLIMVVPLITFASVTNVPKKVKSTFNKQYGDTYVEWNRSVDGNLVATFVVDMVINKAVYNSKGEWIETTANLKEVDLHPCVTEYLEDTYDYFEFWDGQTYADPETSGIEYYVTIKIEEIIEGEEDIETIESYIKITFDSSCEITNIEEV